MIFLVVLGHAVGAACHFTSGATSRMMSFGYKWIYLFHMPAFFFVAGWTKRPRPDDGWRAVLVCLKKGTRRLLLPYAFWGVASALLFFATLSLTSRMAGTASGWYYSARMFDVSWWRPLVSLLHGGGWPNGEGFRCNSVLWFLPCLFVTLVANEVVARFRIRGLGRLALIALCWCGGGWVRLSVGLLPWGIDRVPRFLGFLLAGTALREFSENAFAGHGRRLLFLGGAVTGLPAYTALAWNFRGFGLAGVQWTWYWAEIGMAVFGCVLTLVLARAIDCRVLAGLGIASLGVMLVHKFPILLVQCGCGRTLSLSGGSAAAFVAGEAVCVTALAWGATSLLRRALPFAIGERRKKLV